MGEPGSPPLTATDAAQVLSNLDAYEENLTLRAEGLTWMIWGLAIPGLFLTYGTASEWANQAGLPWLNALFWLPWILAAGLATRSLWRSLALAFDWEDDGKPAWATLGYTILFFALAAGLWITGLVSNITLLMLATTGLLTVAIALVPLGENVGKPTWVLFAGALLLLSAILLDLAWAQEATGLQHQAVTLSAAALVGLVYLALGLTLIAKG